MPSTREKIKSKIVKLLAMAKDKGASEAEVFTALKAARALMTKAGIEESELSQGDHDGPSVIPASVAVKSRFETWEKITASVVELITDTRAIFVRVAGRTGLVYCGSACDIEAAAQLYHTLIACIRTGAKRCGFRDKAPQRTAFRSYCLGYAIGLEERTAQLYEVEASTLPAIVSKRDAINDFLGDQLPDLRPIKARPTTVDTGAFGMGKSDGRRSDLGRQKLAH